MEASCWYFTKENLENTPSRKCGVEASKELSYRQQAANFIQDMGQRLQVTQLCINTAIVYMHRFYMFHSFTKLHRNQLAVAALFLAAKVEEQPRKLEHVVRVAHKCLHRGEDLDPKSEDFQAKCNELVSQENMMLQTLGFDIAIVHPHTYVVKLLQLVKASKDLAQTSYFMATNSLHLTTMCLQYKPTVVACVCIHLACKWSKWKIEPCSEGKEWYFYVDKSVTPELLEELTRDFLVVLEKSPNRLKRKVGPENNKDGQSSQSKSTEEIAGRVEQMYDVCIEPMKKDMSPTPSTSSMTFVDNFLKIKDEIPDDFLENPYNPAVEPAAQSATLKKPKSEPPHSISLAVYREKQEKKQLLENKALLAVTTASSVTDFPPPPPPLTSTVSAPKLIAPPEKPVLVAPEKLAVLHPEKRLPHKLLATSSELVPQRMPDKNNHKNLTSSSHLDVVSSEKINHLIPKAMVAPMPQVNQLPPKVPVVQSTVAPHPRNDLPKIAPEAIKSSKDPFVLLTRVDQSQFEKQISSDIKPGQHITLPLNASSKGNNNAPPSSTHKSRSRHTKPESVPTNWGKDLVNADSHASVKHKSKMNAVVMQNNHNDVQHSTQGTIPKQSPPWDPTKANGSKVPEQPAAAELPFPLLPETSKPVEKPVEVHNKHERREKHKHKHSVHSSRDRANHVADSTPDHGMPGGIKITIPKDKLLLSGIRSEGSQKSSSKEDNSRTSLKIKIKPPPVPESTPISVAKVNSTGSSLKLVITKDKNAGSYSASRKAASRKRDRSPSSKMHNSRSSGKSAKLPKLDGIANPSLPNPNSAHNMVKQTDLDVVYNNLAQQPYVMPACNPPPYFQQFCPYPVAQTNVPYGFPPPLPPQSHSINSAPPLPRDPPPPLPPQPPAT